MSDPNAMDEQTKPAGKEARQSLELSVEHQGYGAPSCGYCKDAIGRKAEFVPDDFGVLLPMHPSCAPEYEDEQHWRKMPAEEKAQLLESARRKIRICELAAGRFPDERPTDYVSLKRTAMLIAYAAAPFLWLIPLVNSEKETFKNDKLESGCMLSFFAMFDAAFTFLPALPYYNNPDPNAVIAACSAPIILAVTKATGVYFLEKERLQKSAQIRHGLNRATEICERELQTLEQKIGDLPTA